MKIEMDAKKYVLDKMEKDGIDIEYYKEAIEKAFKQIEKKDE